MSRLKRKKCCTAGCIFTQLLPSQVMRSPTAVPGLREIWLVVLTDSGAVAGVADIGKSLAIPAHETARDSICHQHAGLAGTKCGGKRGHLHCGQAGNEYTAGRRRDDVKDGIGVGISRTDTDLGEYRESKQHTDPERGILYIADAYTFQFSLVS